MNPLLFGDKWLNLNMTTLPYYSRPMNYSPSPWWALAPHLCSPPKQPTLQQSAQVWHWNEAGKGLKALFWHEKWVGPRSLKLVLPRLFSITMNPLSSIFECGYWEGSL